MEIRAITFDVGGTLIRPWPSVGHVYAETAARHGAGDLSPATLNRQFAAAWKELKNFHHGREEWAKLVDSVFAGLTVQRPSETFFTELYDRFAEPEAWEIFDDALPALDSLASLGIKLGIISNWDERLETLLHRLGLRKYFETTIISCEAGFSKPSPVVFELAARKLGVAPGFILHVGDSLREDVEGAKSAGFHALLIDREAVGEKEGKICSLLELSRLV